ncbi:hypothetical protein E2493_20090 [Sphingomonas parva]|uniref:Uncharacterized protein n=1 Tax=Sphingomonas parva TaxID=2555898 RepID=A0A4Y8ZLY7_9SPHN|nr:hypothetical protein [Sphingomonas parva]TFI56467.1 hypothetical protein E2493_20090 [Sphingomonas parva]
MLARARSAARTAAAAAILASSATAGGADPAAPFHCEAPGGDYTPTPLADARRTLAARIRLTATERDRTWAPTAGLLFVLGDKRHAGVQVYVPVERPDGLLIGLRRPGTDRPEVFARTALNAPVDVEARLDDNGLLTVAAGTITKSVRLKGAAATGAILMCSSGAFTFERLSPPPEATIDGGTDPASSTD